jgi:uncharacterized protein YbjT (DUF2867 family)
MILVAGATGAVGSEICKRLIARGQVVRALVRRTSNPTRLAELKQCRAELAYGDLRDRASLDAACGDVATVVTTATTTVSRQPRDSIEATDRDGQLNLVAAAKAAGVRHFVYVSYSNDVDNTPSPCPLTEAKRAVERAVRESGMAYTILRPSYFTEFWLGPGVGFDYANAKATIYGSGHGKVSYISSGDVVEFAVQSVDNPVARNAVIELGGPEPLSQLEAVAIFEEVSGKQFQLQFVPAETLEAQQAGATDSLSRSFAALMCSLVVGNTLNMSDTLRQFPINLKSVRDYAKSVVSHNS